ncbi:MAG: ExeM/NucH family extracellular endonuclease, partial [Actinomycetota bacterium]
GSALTLTLTAQFNGGSEAVAFQNILISSAGGGGGPVAFDMVGSGSQNLVSFTNPFNGAFASAGDGFQKYQRGVSSSIPFGVADDSLVIFPPDTLGIIKDGNTDEFFGVIDTENPQNAGPVSATWVFDISGGSGLSLSIDMGAMGDFEASDTFVWEYSIDGGPTMTAFASSVDEAGSHTYTMEGGASVPLDDPMFVGSDMLTNDLATLTTAVGTGSALTLTLTAQFNGGSEAVAFQNILISSAGGGGVPPPVDPDFGSCSDGTQSLIHDIQGLGLTSPQDGIKHVIEGVVVGDFQAATELNGFFLQEEDADVDGSAFTSEGIFVFDNGFGVDVEAGDVVRVKGTVDEVAGMTQLVAITDLSECADQVGGASTASVSLPVSAVTDLEFYEGMHVHIAQKLYVTNNAAWHLAGEATLSVGGVLDNPTNVVAPGGPTAALQDLNNRSQVQLDDGSRVFAPWPPPYLQAGDTLRRGSTIPELTGVLGAQGIYEIHPTGPVSFAMSNARSGPPGVGGSIQVGAFNVLNYFTTIDDSGPICGPSSDQDCRGADTADEFARQRAKIIDAVATLDAEVLGLMELENAPGDAPQADLVAGLNAKLGAGSYEYIATGAIGDDAIRVALIYQPAEVTPVGGFAILDSSVDPTFNDDKNRPVLAQTFEEIATGELFTVAVNHLKSKGSSCASAPENDPDAGDGQGNCNGVRTAAAAAQAAWLATDPTGSGDPDSIIVGDLNAYAQEDPVNAIEAAGYTDLIQLFHGKGEYSFVFQGQSGYLDHALSSPSFTDDVTKASFWHINADEPSGLDYNDFNPPQLYKADEWRSSDHDPVLVGLDMANPMGMAEKVLEDLQGLLPTGNNKDDKAIARAIKALEGALDPDLWTGEDTLDPKHGHSVFDGFKQAIVHLAKAKGVSDAIETLVEVADELARTAIDDAIAADGDAAKIAAAEDDYAAGVSEAAADDFTRALDSFRSAWQNAIESLKKGDVRFATFNASMNRSNEGDLVAELSAPGSTQPAVIAEIIQRTRPEVLLINEFDFDAGGLAAQYFQDNYLGVSQRGADPIVYPYRFVAPSNTGIPSGFDLNNDSTIGGPDDAYGFGFFPGQYGMVVYSMHPIEFGK